MKKGLYFVTFTISLLLACCTTSQDLKSLESELLQTDIEWATAAKMNDIEKLTSFWADDAINFFPGVPPAYGKESILELVRRNRLQSGFSLSWDPKEAVVAASGEIGYTYGEFIMTIGNPESGVVQRSGNYVCIWRKDTGSSWKCYVESTIFNSQ